VQGLVGTPAVSVLDVGLHSDVNLFFFGTKDAEAVKQVFESVVETREELRSVADGMPLGPLILSEWSLIILSSDACESIELREDSTRRHEELRHMLLANASARESMSFGDAA